AGYERDYAHTTNGGIDQVRGSGKGGGNGSAALDPL
ncbi:MAG: hypothetical protein RLZZ546_1585, partial [Bacteroidota bacterium]